MGDVGRAPEAAPRPEVPDEWVDIAVRANATRNHADLCGCVAWPERCVSGYTPGQWEHGDEAETIAAVVPVIERQLRQQIARDIDETADADVIGPYEAGLDRAARVARGERLPGAPAPTLDDLARRAASIALPSEPADILAALLRIGGDLARAYESAQRADMERELGNLVVSSLRWMVRYGLDPRRCIETAERAQRAYAEREGRHG